MHWLKSLELNIPNRGDIRPQYFVAFLSLESFHAVSPTVDLFSCAFTRKPYGSVKPYPRPAGETATENRFEPEPKAHAYGDNTDTGVGFEVAAHLVGKHIAVIAGTIVIKDQGRIGRRMGGAVGINGGKGVKSAGLKGLPKMHLYHRPILHQFPVLF